jgi:transcriptional regulator of arginine metabolism
VTSQEQLRGLLEAKGFTVTQSTLSRDIKELELMKGSRGYQLSPPEDPVPADAGRRLEHAVHQYLLKCTCVQNMVVLKTAAGHAQALAVAVDQVELDGVLGTVGGDDTVLLIHRDEASAAKVAAHLETLAAGPS